MRLFGRDGPSPEPESDSRTPHSDGVRIPTGSGIVTALVLGVPGQILALSLAVDPRAQGYPGEPNPRTYVTGLLVMAAALVALAVIQLSWITGGRRERRIGTLHNRWGWFRGARLCVVVGVALLLLSAGAGAAIVDGIAGQTEIAAPTEAMLHGTRWAIACAALVAAESIWLTAAATRAALRLRPGRR